MKVIHRYILKELLATFALSVVGLNFVLMTERVLRLSMMFAYVGASAWDIALIVLYVQPEILRITVPLALLITLLLVYGRLNADSELVVLRTSGMTFGSLLVPSAILGCMAFAIGMALSMYMLPESSKILRAHISGVLTSRAPNAIEEGVFNTKFEGVVIYAAKREEGGALRDVFIYDHRVEKRPSVMFAESAGVAVSGSHITLALRDGHMVSARAEDVTEIGFKAYNMSFPIPMEYGIEIDELTPAALLMLASIQEESERRLTMIEFHRRFSLSVLCLLVMVFAVPLAFRAGKTGKLGGLTFGLIVIMAFYALQIWGESMARSGALPVPVGSWMPVAALAVFTARTYAREAAK